MLIGREKEQEMLHNSLWHAALRFAAIRGDRWGFFIIPLYFVKNSSAIPLYFIKKLYLCT